MGRFLILTIYFHRHWPWLSFWRRLVRLSLRTTTLIITSITSMDTTSTTWMLSIPCHITWITRCRKPSCHLQLLCFLQRLLRRLLLLVLFTVLLHRSMVLLRWMVLQHLSLLNHHLFSVLQLLFLLLQLLSMLRHRSFPLQLHCCLHQHLFYLHQHRFCQLQLHFYLLPLHYFLLPRAFQLLHHSCRRSTCPACTTMCCHPSWRQCPLHPVIVPFPDPRPPPTRCP